MALTSQGRGFSHSTEGKAGFLSEHSANQLPRPAGKLATFRASGPLALAGEGGSASLSFVFETPLVRGRSPLPVRLGGYFARKGLSLVEPNPFLVLLRLYSKVKVHPASVQCLAVSGRGGVSWV